MSEPIKKGAVVGCGAIAPRHLKAWIGIPDVQIFAVCDPDVQRAQAIADKFAVEHVYCSIEELLSAQSNSLDFIDITTPPASHVQLVQQAVAGGHHVICQKPLAETREDLAEIVRLSTASKSIVGCNEMWKFLPGYAQAGALLRDGHVGTIQQVRFRSASNFLLPRADGSRAFGLFPRFLSMKRLILFEYGIHILDMFRSWFGEPEALRASISRTHFALQGEDAASISLRFSRFQAQIELDWCALAPTVDDVLEADSLVILTDEGLLSVEAGRIVTWRSITGDLQQWKFEGDLRDVGFLASQKDFIRSLRDGTRPASAVQDNAKSVELMLRCYESGLTNDGYVPAI
jgi:D-apiose dehydrogenase